MILNLQMFLYTYINKHNLTYGYDSFLKAGALWRISTKTSHKKKEAV